MRKLILLFCSTLFAVATFALSVNRRENTNALLLYDDDNALFVFEKEPELISTIGNVAWYNLSDTVHAIQESSSYLDGFTGLQHGQGYMIKKDSIREVFWVFEYEQLRPTINDVTLSCTEAEIHIHVPSMTYRNEQGEERTYERSCRVTYTDAVWREDMWVDSIATLEQPLRNPLIAGASPVATEYIVLDQLAQQLHLNDLIYSEEYQPIALKHHPITITTVRGKNGERNNEIKRPYDPNQSYIKGSELSGPLEILFRANGLNVDYYEWKLYESGQHLLTRKDAEHRYTFDHSGTYSVVLCVSNDHCALDSVSFKVIVSQSDIWVPNVFTPNGDGDNDEFRVVYRSIKEFHCWVYNRWGMLVYQWSDPAKGWDGTIGGRPAAEGAYFYVIRALGTDADENAKYTLKPVYKKQKEKQDESLLGVYQLSGSINLLRGGKK